MKDFTKAFLLLFFVANVGYADDGAAAFATGFANGLNQAMYGQQYAQNAQQVNVTYRQYNPEDSYYQRPVNHYYTTFNEYGTPTGLRFPTFTDCEQSAFSQGQECRQVEE